MSKWNARTDLIFHARGQDKRGKTRTYELTLGEVQAAARDLLAIVAHAESKNPNAQVIVTGKMQAAVEVMERVAQPDERTKIAKTVRDGIATALAKLHEQGVVTRHNTEFVPTAFGDTPVKARTQNRTRPEVVHDGQFASAAHRTGERPHPAFAGLSPEARAALEADPEHQAGLAQAAALQRDYELTHLARSLEVTADGPAPRVKSNGSTDAPAGDPAQRVGDDGPVRLPLAAELVSGGDGQPQPVDGEAPSE